MIKYLTSKNYFLADIKKDTGQRPLHSLKLGRPAGISLWLTLLLFTSFSPTWAADPKVALLAQVPPIPFDPPPIQTHTFADGMKLYFLENKELPIFQMSALIQAGYIHEPSDKKGLTSFMMKGIRTGGAKSLTGEEVDRQLEQTDMSLSADEDHEYSEMKIRSLAPQIPQAVGLFFDLLKSPRFDPEKMEIARKLMLDQISRRNEDPMDIARREYSETLYGTENVWARVPTAKTVSSLTRDDVLRYYERFVAPNRIWLAVSGNIRFRKLVSLIEAQTRDWPQRETTLPSPSPLVKEWIPSVQIISRPVNQSSIVMGHFGEKRWNEDKYALTLANYILGGSTFASRLGTQIRTNLGLAYSVSSFFTFATDYGEFEIIASTKSASTLKVIRETQKIIRAIVETNPITRRELDDAKTTILNQLIFEYDDLSKIVEAQRFYDFYGYPPDYLKIYQEKISRVTLAEVKNVLAKYFFPDKLIVMIVGNKNEMGDLSSLGTVIERPLDND